MNTTPSAKATQVCEKILTGEKGYNIQHAILPSENAIIENMLSRSVELKEAYEEIFEKLYSHDFALERFLELVLSTAAFWSPKEISESRANQKRLIEINQQIADRASDLAHLLEERSDLHDKSSFGSDTHYDICRVIEAAAAQNFGYNSWVREPLAELSSRFDLKYWPSLSEFMDELALDAERADIAATNPITAVATEAVRPSLADFFKALFVAIEKNSKREYGRLPNNPKFSDNTFASLVNCALNLDPDNMVDAQYVKRFRQRERDKSA